MKTLGILIICALFLALTHGPAMTVAQYSPLPARSPIAVRQPDGRCPPGHYCAAQEPRQEEAEQTTAPCSRPGWYRLPDWMGRYELWTDGGSYCIGELR
jgi:hypothetical protein